MARVSRTRASGPSFDGRGIEAVFGLVGGHFQFHGGLAFVGPGPADVQGRGHRVEEASGAGGEGRIQPLGQLAAQDALFQGGILQAQPPGLAEEVFPIEGIEIGRGHAARVLDRGFPAREAHGGEVAGPGKTGQVRHQEFPAPDGAVGAVARAVQGDADHRSVRRFSARQAAIWA